MKSVISNLLLGVVLISAVSSCSKGADEAIPTLEYEIKVSEEQVVFVAGEEGRKVIYVSTPAGDWNYEACCDWLEVEKGDSYISFYAPKYTKSDRRRVDIKVTGANCKDAYIEVVQYGLESELEAETDLVLFASDETGKRDVRINSAFDNWKASVDSDEFIVEKSGSRIYISPCGENTQQEPKTAVVTISVGLSKYITITVVQEGK